MKRAFLLTAILAAGCGPQAEDPVSTLCTEGPGPVATALQKAPGAVTLEDGTQLSDCIDDATTDAELQNVGIVMTDVAEDLELQAPTNVRAALQLGYLVGAARRGAGSASALQAELVRRLERSANLDGPTPSSRRALARGLAAGEKAG